jgi:hypothetical protein
MHVTGNEKHTINTKKYRKKANKMIHSKKKAYIKKEIENTEI